MRQRHYPDNRRELAKWIGKSAEFNAFVTVTLKQAIQSQISGSAFHAIQPEDCRKTAWLFRDRLARKVHREKKLQRSMPFAAFVEGDNVKRFHLHFMTVCPPEMDFESFRMAVCAAVKNLVWVYDHVDVRPITYGCPESLSGEIIPGCIAFST